MMGMEIIPNWHPILVHFTVALLSLSAMLYLVGMVLRKPNLLVVARWNLWIGMGITVGTVLAGFYAYNTVAHDGPSHAAMTNHKNWALATAAIFSILAIWSLAKHRGAKAVGLSFVVLILLASSLLAITGYKGGEVVYRHGTGVMRMPAIAGDGGHGSHSHGGNTSAGHHDGAADPDAHDDHKGHGAEMEMPAEEGASNDHGEHSH